VTAEPLESEIGAEIPTALYRFFDADGKLLYVGVTGDLRTRFAQHASVKSWWSDVARKTVAWHATRARALAAEAEAIAAEEPEHNIAEICAALRPRADRHRMQPLTFRPPRPLRAWLQAYAEATERPVGAIIAEALTEYRDRMG
jgi:predicted GIY-YIG superfamily endonuclease